MSTKAHPLRQPSLAALRAALDAPSRALLAALERAAAAGGVEVWLVGGAVRDLALGRPLFDLDVAVDGDAAPLAAATAAQLGPRRHPAIAVAPRFGTASVTVGGGRLDLARLRHETYGMPGALPRVAFARRVEEDLRRRDFTVNAMALGLVGSRRSELVDPCGGLADLAAKRLRVLHPRAFVDDATRLWRGARTAALFALTPDAETARLIAEGTRWLDTISGERLAAEFAFTAERGRAGRTLAIAEGWGVLRGTHAALRLTAASAEALRHRPLPLPPARLAAVVIAPLAARRAILDRFAASRELRATVEETARLLAAGTGTPPLERLAPLAGTRDEARVAARWLDPAGQRDVQRALARWERTRAPLDAEALIALGIARGPALGRALDGLRRARYLGTLGSAAAARREVRRRLAAGAGW